MSSKKSNITCINCLIKKKNQIEEGYLFDILMAIYVIIMDLVNMLKIFTIMELAIIPHLIILSLKKRLFEMQFILS